MHNGIYFSVLFYERRDIIVMCFDFNSSGIYPEVSFKDFVSWIRG